MLLATLPYLRFTPVHSARNVLLLTLIAEKTSVPTIWNIFYHMYLDAGSHAVLIAQCKKLVEASASMESWRASPYAACVRFSTEYTLSEVRRHWSLYVAMPDLPAKRRKAIVHAFEQVFKRNGSGHYITSSRSAGPLLVRARGVDSTVSRNYWKTGTTFFEQKDVSAAKLANPTFAYSLDGEGCALHYSTDPLVTFHFAAVFGNAKRTLSAAEMVRSAREEFSDWCAAFVKAVYNPGGPPRIRMFLGEALAAGRALKSFDATGTLNMGVPVAQFRTQLIRLDKHEYVDSKDRAPSSFNVVETSNLVDYVGLLNILAGAVPLMAASPSSVLYTETLLFRGEDATKEFAQLLNADIGTMGMLLDICPVDYLSGFNTRSNTHEILLYRSASKESAGHSVQFHQVTTWKSPAACDSLVALRGGRVHVPPVFDVRQLGTLLFDMYQALFEQEDSHTFQRKNERNMDRAISTSNKIHYMREGFVLFLKLVRERLRMPPADWTAVMDRLVELELNDLMMPMNTVNRNDFYAHLHKQGLYTIAFYENWIPKLGRFARWDGNVPPVVRIVLSVPREKITAFEDALAQTSVGTPLLQCDVIGRMSHNIFAAIHLAYGRAIAAGSPGNPRVIFEEDPEGRNGSQPLVVSFLMSAGLLTTIEPPENLRVRLCVRSTVGTVALHAKLGFALEIFGASLMDEEHVHVLPENPVTGPRYPSSDGSIFSPNAALRTEIGQQHAITVELDEQCELVDSLVTRVDIEDQDVIRDFGSGAIPEIVQASPCVMRLTVAGHVQDVVFPFPVVGTDFKLRLARKSRYIEVRLRLYTCARVELTTWRIIGASPDRRAVPQTRRDEAQSIPHRGKRPDAGSVERASSRPRSAARPQHKGCSA